MVIIHIFIHQSCPRLYPVAEMAEEFRMALNRDGLVSRSKMVSSCPHDSPVAMLVFFSCPFDVSVYDASLCS